MSNESSEKPPLPALVGRSEQVSNETAKLALLLTVAGIFLPPPLAFLAAKTFSFWHVSGISADATPFLSSILCIVWETVSFFLAVRSRQWLAARIAMLLSLLAILVPGISFLYLQSRNALD